MRMQALMGLSKGHLFGGPVSESASVTWVEMAKLSGDLSVLQWERSF